MREHDRIEPDDKDVDEQPTPVIVHNDHHVIVNYNASGRAERSKHLTRTSTDRQRGARF